MKRRVILLLLFVATVLPLHAQRATQGSSQSTLRVFLDCSGFRCDQQFYRSEIDWVDYVRDRQDADVHLLITRQRTGGGGWEFTLEFLGQNELARQQLELRHVSPRTATEDEEREGLARTIKLGLAPLVAAAVPGAPGLEVSYQAPEGMEGTTPLETTGDPWNYWTFRTRLGGAFGGEARRSSWNLDGSFNAERVTEEWKIELEADGSQSHGRFVVDSATTVTSENHRYSTGVLVVRSMGPHWSAGGRAGAESSTRFNQRLAVTIAPALEYSVYPYELFNRRQLTFLYSLGLSHFNYEEVTIFGETAETRPNHSLRGSLELNQPWGQVDVSLEGRQFLHDPGRYSLQLFNRLDVRLLRGLSASAFGRVSYIRDQLFLPAGEADPEEVLLNLRQLETNYEYFVSLGLSYTFGSIYSTVVNPRF